MKISTEYFVTFSQFIRGTSYVQTLIDLFVGLVILIRFVIYKVSMI